MDRVVALLRRKDVLAGLAVAILVIGGIVWWTGGDDDSAPVAAPTESATTPTPEVTTPTPTPTATSETPDVPCEGPDTTFTNGEVDESLLPDCGQPVVPAGEKKPLGLGCGGDYPVILYKTDTPKVRSSICGETSSGENLRVVIKRDGEAARDLDGDYDYTIDGFVAEDGDTTWRVLAYNGEITSERGGKTASSGPGDWMSLDNEDDGD